MGLKYSINSAGRIVAERDIYSLGGFIPKGRLGGAIKDETQLSQEGECWLAGGNISTRPDVRIKDNAYIGDFFANEQAVHTDGITEFSGNTLIPGSITIRSFAADTKNNVFVKDSFIGVSMDVLCGPASNTKAFPFEQGRYNQDAPKGTLFTSATMKIAAENFMRNTATLRLGRATYIHIPAGYNARIYWGYYDASNQLAYAGESEIVSSNLYKVSHPIYNVCMVAIANNPTLTPEQLGNSGAKILGHISGSLLQDLRPESASGEYAMVNSSFIAETDNFGLNTTQLRFLAGSMYDTTMYTKTDRQDYKPYGTFRNVERLEYTKYLSDSHRTAATRDTYISGFDCPLLRVDDDTYDTSLTGTGDLVLRRCIVPKGKFAADPINGNTYEDLDFSYANEDLGYAMAGYSVFNSSHREGLYRVKAGTDTLGLVSHKGNLADTARLYQDIRSIPLDGDIIEQGSYGGSIGILYESAKSDNSIRIRTGKPLATFGLVFPALPSGYSVKALYYLDEKFIVQTSSIGPTEITTTYPYVVMTFGRNDERAITPSEFIALNRTLRMIDHTKAPEITGSAYVGAGCTVRGDVQLHGDPYVNRVFDVNEWDRGGLNTAPGLTWDVMKDGRNSDVRMTTKSIYPVNPGDTISVSGAYRILLCWFNSDRELMSDTGWNDGTLTIPANVYYVGIALSTKPDLKLLDFPDIPLANVKYLRAFKKRRYITNELDRKSPEDVFLTEDQWRVAAISTGQAYIGRIYDTLIGSSTKYCILKRPINAGASWTVTLPDGVGNVYTPFNSSWDALTKLLGLGVKANAALTGLELNKVSGENVTLKDVPAARFIVEFVPQPRIITPYGVSNVWIEGTKVRMYDNSVLSRTITTGQEVTLKGDAVMGSVFTGDVCICSNGHDDAIITKP